MEERLNLTKQLQQTPKWKEFEEWYLKQSFILPFIEIQPRYDDDPYILGFWSLEFEFQKGVFEKFIESNEHVFEQTSGRVGFVTYSIWQLETGYRKSNSFEELLIWYFNN